MTDLLQETKQLTFNIIKILPELHEYLSTDWSEKSLTAQRRVNEKVAKNLDNCKRYRPCGYSRK